ncbi:MAG: bifunctional lysylphosphatidylglycerol flippase/synthetase MprF [Solirubrobacteraceae bacterium]
MSGLLRARRRVAPWIVVAAAIGAWLIIGLRLTAMACGVMLMIALAAVAVRARDGGPETVPPPRRRAIVWAAAIAWALAGVATLAGPVSSSTVTRTVRHVLRPLTHASARVLTQGYVSGSWTTLIDVLVGGALITSVLAVRALRPPTRLPGPSSPDALTIARAVVEAHGEDSLSPFLPRPDKRFEFAGGGVLAYCVIGRTAIVSGDPVGPSGSELEVLRQLRRRAHRAGMRVVLYGASARHLAGYREQGLRSICVGEEAVVDPAGFTLEGRAVRKLRQSVHRVNRRGWRIAALEGREIGAELETDIDALERAWRSGRDRLLGFAMAMGEFEPGVRPADLYLLAWSPDGELRAVMRFLAHRGRLSLDTMRRIGETPNGLNEVLVCRALEFARAGGIDEVSLNYAGLGHLVRRGPAGNRALGILARMLLNQLGRQFQMDRLVAFNEKFSPEWRPRYLVYESRAALPGSALRVLQAEGYVPERRQLLAGRVADLSRRLARVAPFTTRIVGRVGR